MSPQTAKPSHKDGAKSKLDFVKVRYENVISELRNHFPLEAELAMRLYLRGGYEMRPPDKSGKNGIIYQKLKYPKTCVLPEVTHDNKYKRDKYGNYVRCEWETPIGEPLCQEKVIAHMKTHFEAWLNENLKTTVINNETIFRPPEYFPQALVTPDLPPEWNNDPEIGNMGRTLEERVRMVEEEAERKTLKEKSDQARSKSKRKE